jgi:hypothetical protein
MNEVNTVILDLNVSGMGGRQCLEELLPVDPGLRVLLASECSSNGLAIDEAHGGARGFIRQPYDTKASMGAIRKVLDRGHLYYYGSISCRDAKICCPKRLVDWPIGVSFRMVEMGLPCVEPCRPPEICVRTDQAPRDIWLRL